MLRRDHTKTVLNRLMSGHGMATIHYDKPPTIEINPKSDDLVSTVIHECLHLVNWDWPHTKIYALEKQLFCYLTDRQLHNLLKRVFGAPD